MSLIKHWQDKHAAAAELIEELKQMGIDLRVDGEMIRFRGKRSIVTEEIKEKIIHHKPEIIKALQAEESSPRYTDVWVRAEGPMLCTQCGVSCNGDEDQMRGFRDKANNREWCVDCLMYSSPTAVRYVVTVKKGL